jgi:ankyrin repeat protein
MAPDSIPALSCSFVTAKSWSFIGITVDNFRGNTMRKFNLLAIITGLIAASVALCSATRGDQGESFIDAAKNNDLTKVQGLLQRGVDVNAKNDHGETSLMLASEQGYLAMVKLLLEKGADVNAADAYGRTALMGASGNDHIEVAKLLLDKGADANAKASEGWTVLMLACLDNHLEIARLLLEKRADVNARNDNGSTSLMEASSRGHVQVVKLLLEKRGEVNAADRLGRTALIAAAENGHTQVVNLLRTHGAIVPPGGLPKPASPERTIDDDLVDTWELLYQVDERGGREWPIEETRTLIEFTNTGDVIFSRIPRENSDRMKSRSGRYAIEGNDIVITDDSGNSVSWPYRVVGDILIVDMPEVKKKFHWRRYR